MRDSNVANAAERNPLSASFRTVRKECAPCDSGLRSETFERTEPMPKLTPQFVQAALKSRVYGTWETRFSTSFAPLTIQGTLREQCHHRQGLAYLVGPTPPAIERRHRTRRIFGRRVLYEVRSASHIRSSDIIDAWFRELRRDKRRNAATAH